MRLLLLYYDFLTMLRNDKKLYYIAMPDVGAQTGRTSNDLQQLLARHRFSLEYICHGISSGKPESDIYISVTSTLMHILKGCGTVTVGPRKLAVRPHAVVYIPPLTKFQHTGNAQFFSVNIHYLIHIRGGRLLDEMRQLPRLFTIVSDPFARNSIKALESLRKTGALVQCAPLAHALVLHYLIKHPLADQTYANPNLNRVIAKLNDSNYQEFNICELARLACVSVRHLERKFKDTVKFSLHQYWDDLRFRRVCAELTSANQGTSLKQIADQFHFHDYPYFHRWFTKKAKRSPGQYRKRLVRLATPTPFARC